MKIYLKILILYIVFCIVNPMLLSAYLKEKNLPGRDVGMMPVAIFIELLIAIPISLFLVYLIRKKVLINEIPSLWIYIVVVFTELMLAGLNPFEEEKEPAYRNLEISIIVITLACSLFLIFLIRLFSRWKRMNIQ
jgi:hypothetical protein